MTDLKKNNLKFFFLLVIAVIIIHIIIIKIFVIGSNDSKPVRLDVPSEYSTEPKL